MSEAPRLFRDFVEKLERAYIAFDGVVGSFLGRAWGGTNHGAESDDVDVIPRNSESNIAERASFSFPSAYSAVPIPLSPTPSVSLVYLTRVLSFLLSRHSGLRPKESLAFHSFLSVYKKVFLPLLFFFFLIAYFPTYLSSSRGYPFSSDINSGVGKRL